MATNTTTTPKTESTAAAPAATTKTTSDTTLTLSHPSGEGSTTTQRKPREVALSGSHGLIAVHY